MVILYVTMWKGRYTFEIDKNVAVMVDALNHYKDRLNTLSYDKQMEHLPVGVKALLQREANSPLELIDSIIEILKSRDDAKIGSLEDNADLLETALKIYKTDLGTVSETMTNKYPGLFGHKESPDIAKKILLIDVVLKGVKPQP